MVIRIVVFVVQGWMVNNMRLIDADELKTKGFADEETGEGIVCVEDIDKAPTIDAMPVVYGRWEEYWDEEYLAFSYRCNKCKKDALTKEGTMHDQVLTHYCPYCGANMRERKE